MSGAGTKDSPWLLKTPPLSSDYEMYLDERDGHEVIVCVVGKTTLLYDARAIDDLHAMLKARGDWVELGGADEQKPAKDDTVEAWGRDPGNPVGGWYGLKKGPAVGSASISRRCSKSSERPSSSTTRATTACARSRFSERRRAAPSR